MTDYKKRIEAMLLEYYKDMWHLEYDELYRSSDRAKLSINRTDEATQAIEALLHQVEAETDRNSRLDELKKLPTKIVYAQEWVDPEIRIPVKRNIDVIDMEDVQRRLDVLAHREES